MGRPDAENCALTALLCILHTSVDEVFTDAKVHATLHCHTNRVCVARSCERTPVDVIPNRRLRVRPWAPL